MTKTTIYKIVHKIPAITNCYVGRTKDVTTRFKQHRICCNNENSKAYNYKLYKTIRETGGLENWNFVELETIEHEPDDASLARERESFWYKELSATLNNNVPNRQPLESKKNWYNKNKEYFKQYAVTYNAIHKDTIAEKRKIYYNSHKKEMHEYTKKWVADNRERNRAYQRERYHKHTQERIKQMADLAETKTV